VGVEVLRVAGDEVVGLAPRRSEVAERRQSAGAGYPRLRVVDIRAVVGAARDQLLPRAGGSRPGWRGGSINRSGWVDWRPGGAFNRPATNCRPTRPGACRI
jgi:hypothetical protein